MGVVNRGTKDAGTTDFSSGTIFASEVNQDFNNIYSEFNGNIDNANVKSAAAIDPEKIDDHSTDDAEQASELDPGLGNATNLQEEIQQLRYVIHRLVSGNNASTDWDTAPISNAITLPTGYISGLTLSKSAATTLGIAVGEAASTNQIKMKVTSAWTKTTAEWVAETGNGGMANGITPANDTWYHVFMLSDGIGSNIDFGFDTSVTAVNLLADADVVADGLTEYRRVGSFKTNSGDTNIQGFTQTSNWFIWDAAPLDRNTTSEVGGSYTFAISTPPGVSCMARVSGLMNSGSGTLRMLFTDPSNTEEADNNLISVWSPIDASVMYGGQADVLTDTSSQIRYHQTGTATNVHVSTIGWQDFRGQ